MSKAPDITEKAAASAKVYTVMGLATVFLMLGSVGVWAVRTDISGAVMSSGVVVVESQVKKVQHPTGGIVAELYVRPGSKVAEGELLVRLDETVTRANLQMTKKQLDELIIREARLEAEHEGADTISIPDSYRGREGDPGIARRIKGETAFFLSRRASLRGQKDQLQERVQQIREEINGLGGQIDSKKKEIELVSLELKGLIHLEKLQLVTQVRVNQLRRDATRLDGERGQLESAVAQARGRITQTEIEILKVENDFRTALIQELRDNRAQQNELVERQTAAEDQLRRVEVRSPRAGIVHELTVHTVGGVVSAAETIMVIVPEDDNLVIEARVAPNDIDQVLQGDKKAYVRFSAFNHHTTPELIGKVSSVSADLSVDPKTGHSHYLVRVAIPKDELGKLDQKKLVPGMPAEIHIKTDDRTALSYLVKPIQDQMQRAFRER
jgi:HlyD family secretion protein